MRFGIINVWSDGKFERETYNVITKHGGKLLEQGTIELVDGGKASYVEYDWDEDFYDTFRYINNLWVITKLPEPLGSKNIPILTAKN